MGRPDLLPAHYPEKSYQPEKWTARHRMIARLSAVGYKNNEIAEMMSMTPSRVSIILSDSRAAIDIAEAVDRVGDNVADLHTRIKIHAVECLDDLMLTHRTTNDEKLRTKIGFGVLDRAGYTPVQKRMEVAPELPRDVAERVEQAILESRGDAVEAEYEIIDDDYEADVDGADLS